MAKILERLYLVGCALLVLGITVYASLTSVHR